MTKSTGTHLTAFYRLTRALRGLMGLFLVLALATGCGSNEEPPVTDEDDVSTQFLNVALGHVYKQNDVEMFFTPDRRLVQKNFSGCMTAVLGENVTITRVPVGPTEDAIKITYYEADIRAIDTRNVSDECKEQIDAAREKMPIEKEMVFCNYTDKVLDASCGREDLRSFNWN